MKKFFALLLSLMMLLTCTAFAETVDMSAPTFEVGEDTAEYEVEGASGYNVVNAFVKIAAGDDVLFNGTVTLTSDTLTVAEFTLAAIYELGCGQEGLEAGFVTSIGDYVAGTDANGNYVYWANSVNGKYVPHTCNTMPVLEGYYINWDFVTYNADAGFVTSMGDYVSGTDANGNYVYWANTVNGKYVPLNCADFRLLDGDYVQWDFVTYVAE